MGKPDVAAAVGVNVPPGLYVWAACGPKLMVWLPIVITTLCGTCGAGLSLLSPGWSAVRVHVPTDRIVTVDPLTVQMLGLSEAKMTGKPDVEVAVRVNVPPRL